VLNQTAFSEINVRCFEAMACGAALLTERGCRGMQDLFVEGETILPGISATIGAARRRRRPPALWPIRPCLPVWPARDGNWF
jgi:hypothetical protein